jgi:hypothetical protein
MRPVPPAVHVTSLVLLINMAIGLFGGPAWLIGGLFITGPILVVWMVYSVLKDSSLAMRDLGEGDEWGYHDRPEIRPSEEP